ncbi:MAG TPA: sigma-70 family RNA polymerase sigma factor [Candidatus Hydrogenedentes bacterium]|nr:sigma-70 family RNA polymerase sigma factor [Candidatus Hydrogenedentota bacterium]
MSKNTNECGDRDLNEAVPSANDVLDPQVSGYVPLLFRIAVRLTGDTAHAEGLVQDVVRQAMAKCPVPNGGALLKPWLLTTLRDAFLKEYRGDDGGSAGVDFSVLPNGSAGARHDRNGFCLPRHAGIAAGAECD